MLPEREAASVDPVPRLRRGKASLPTVGFAKGPLK